MNTELKRMMNRIKDAQKRLQKIVKDQDWVGEARRYAEKQSVEVKKLFSTDMDKVKIFLERERKELEKFQKQIPSEVKKFRELLMAQRIEFEKLIRNLSKNGRGATEKDGSSSILHGVKKSKKAAHAGAMKKRKSSGRENSATT